jgi:pimeloyl-ACP methyl ester carboxylesterase
MKEHRYRVNGLTLNCVDYGGEGKQAILFIHGGAAHARWWDFVGPSFIDDFHVLALDQRGHGESEWPAEWSFSSGHYVADIDAVLDQWGFGAPILIGHSMGAHNVLAYAVEHSDRLRAMVAVDCPADYNDEAVAFMQRYAEKPARVFGSLEEAVENFKVMPRETQAKKEVLDYVARLSYMRRDDGTWIHKVDRRTMIRQPAKVWNLLSNIKCPSLIIKINDSPVLELKNAKKMIAKIPNAQLAQIDNSFHHVMLDNPAALIATLKDFLADFK